mgnify:CR=1 FL=1
MAEDALPLVLALGIIDEVSVVIVQLRDPDGGCPWDLDQSFRTIVPEECVADKHESPHFANLYDMALKYADVLPVVEVISGGDVEQAASPLPLKRRSDQWRPLG